MRKHVINIVSIATLFLSGCESFLSKVPDDRTQITDVEAVKALLVSAYPEALYMMLGEVMSDNADDKGSYLVSSVATAIEECYFWKEVTIEYQDTPGFYWANCYSAIAAANHALEAIEVMGNTPELLPYRGEALLCRAYAHFMLVNFWGEHFDPATSGTELGVPYATIPEKVDLAYYQRATVKEVYDLIEKDLKEGLPLIRDDVYDVTKYHFNREAANAFASRYYTYRGDSWDLVKQYSDAVLGEGTDFKSYLRDYPGKYRPFSSNPTEFAKLYTNYGEASNLLIIGGYSYWGNTAGFSRYGMSQRVEKWVIDSLDVANTPWMNSLIWGTYPHYVIYKFTPFFKYLYPGSNLGYVCAFNPAFTAEEVMFNRMEAYVMNHQFDEIINDFHLYWSMRTNNYIPDSKFFDRIKEYYNEYLKGKWERPDPWYRDQLDEDQLVMLKYITDVRRKEFMQQGMRWFDIKRFHIPVRHAVYASAQYELLTKDDPRRVLQIPPTAIDYGITPNPR
ncbi:MAG: RagB/SusD family nutrient uptake outer membrane protein [Odoribacteraceae bacterium]|jgi:hypothetical protein|nr:RagB/SusD family nutrient uptake outer membrane protein [Odoribacteraceae bacterium]